MSNSLPLLIIYIVKRYEDDKITFSRDLSLKEKNEKKIRMFAYIIEMPACDNLT